MTVAYDGTDFCGWAAQPGQRTVQSTLKEAVRRVTGEDVEVIGASRTDSGAHALGQVCHFDSEVGIETTKWARVLNTAMPQDISVLNVEYVSNEFHSRFCADDRWYRYRIRTTPRDPFISRVAHNYNRAVKVSEMQRAADSLVGKHDFKMFTEELADSVENTVRELRSIKLTQTETEVHIDIVGTAFLRGMMRRISGFLLEVGRGYRTAEDGPKLLAGDTTVPQSVVLPAKGLCLMEVRYTNPLRDIRTASNLA